MDRRPHVRNDKSLLHALRKFCDNGLNKDHVHPNSIKKIMGHKNGLQETYYRPESQDLFDEYKLAIPSLTISEEKRSKFQVKKLEEQQEKTEEKLSFVEMEKNMYKIQEQVDTKLSTFGDTLERIFDMITKKQEEQDED